MKTLELDDETAHLLDQLIQREHIDAAQLVKQALADYLRSLPTIHAEKEELMSDIIASLPALPTFTGDPLTIQKTMRDEWD
ncbi:MAG: ribbon-helix-helix protein, CopG family [Methylobacter sp.]